MKWLFWISIWSLIIVGVLIFALGINLVEPGLCYISLFILFCTYVEYLIYRPRK